jgi:hypothetical protein
MRDSLISLKKNGDAQIKLNPNGSRSLLSVMICIYCNNIKIMIQSWASFFLFVVVFILLYPTECKLDEIYSFKI